jgi:hypothetical protein
MCAGTTLREYHAREYPGLADVDLSGDAATASGNG